ncbi:MAG: hypothetical protein Q9208_005676 [Pyrenodesmia sp. 3 TL-2023]
MEVEAIPNSRLGLIPTQDRLIGSQGIRSTIHQWVEDGVVSPEAVITEAVQLRDSSPNLNHEALRELCLNNSPTSDSPTEHTGNLKENNGSSASRYPHKRAFPAEKTLPLPAKAGPGTSDSPYAPVPISAVWPNEAPKQAKTTAEQEQENGRVTPTPKATRRATLPRASRNRQYQALNHCFASSQCPGTGSSNNPPSGSTLRVFPGPDYVDSRHCGQRPRSLPPPSTRVSPSSTPSTSSRLVTPFALELALRPSPLRTLVSPVFSESPASHAGSVRTITGRHRSPPLSPVFSSPPSVPSSLSIYGTDSPLPYTLRLPSVSPQTWTTNRLCSAHWFDRGTKGSGHASEDGYADELPSTIQGDERFYVCFPQGITGGFYQVELHMGIHLSRPDRLGWQDFSLPGLSMHPCTESSSLLEFSLSSPSGDSAYPTQFEPTGLLVPEQEESGRLQGTFRTGNEGVMLRVRSSLAVQRLEHWNSTVLIYSTVSCEPGLGPAIKYSISLSVDPKEECFTKRVMLAVLIKNGPRNDGTYSLKPGECVIHLASPAIFSSDSSIIQPAQISDKSAANDCNGTVEVLIERDSCDLNKRLVLEFTRHYPDREKTSIYLPRIMPKVGKVHSEKIWLLKPSPPLRFHAVPRPFLSTWQVNRRRIANREILCFDRIEVPTLFPTAFTDDAVVQIRTFEATLFDAVSADASCMAIPSLRMDIDIVAGRRLQCRMFFVTEVGIDDNRIIQIDAVGWQPKYAMVNDRFSSNHYAPWWNDDDTFMNLFKASWMQPGQKLQVELCFVINEHTGGEVTDQGDWIKLLYPLPRVTEKTIRQGDLLCTHDDAAVAVNCQTYGGPECRKLCFDKASGNDRQSLPSLPRGYQLCLEYRVLNPAVQNRPRASKVGAWAGGIRFAGGLPLQPRAVRFADEDSNTSNDGDDESNDLDADGSDSVDSNDESSMHDVGRDDARGPDDGILPTEEDEHANTPPSHKEDDTLLTAMSEDQSSSSDDHASNHERETSPEEEEEEDDDLDELDIEAHAQRIWVAFWHYLIHPAWQLYRHLRRTSCAHFLVRVLFLECIVCMIMPWAYFGGQPARAVGEVVRNVVSMPGEMVLGDFEGLVVAVADAGVEEGMLGVVVQEEEEEKGSAVWDAKGGEVQEGVMEEASCGLGWRDRIDLALGWRPPVS